MILSPLKKGALFFLIVGATSCGVSKQSARILTLQNSYCEPPTYFVKPVNDLSANSASVIEAGKELSDDFTKQNILMLYALNLSGDIKELWQIRSDTTLAKKMHKLEIKNKVNSALLMAMSDVNAAAAELDCDGERVDQVAAYIDNINSSKNSKFLVTSIALGAATSIAGALISSSNANKAVAIGGGVLGGGLGFLTLNPKGKKTEFYHKRNLLRTIWQQTNADGSFSPFIWYMLSEKSFSNSGKASLAQNLKKRWIEFQFDHDESQGDKNVIFSDGGIYRSDDLHSRAAMNNQLQAVIRSINQNINNLMIDINKIYVE